MNKPELITALQAIAASKGVDLSWLDVDLEFKWRGVRHIISSSGTLFIWNDVTKTWDDYMFISTMYSFMSEVDQIKPISLYTLAEAEQAKKDMECSADFRLVTEDMSGRVKIWTSKPEYDEARGEWWGEDGISISVSLYPSLKPGTKERLDVIAGCGE